MRPAKEAQLLVPRRRTTRNELHWRAGSGLRKVAPGTHEWAVADKILGARDWAAIDPARLRRSAGVRHRFTPALHFWEPDQITRLHRDLDQRRGAPRRRCHLVGDPPQRLRGAPGHRSQHGQSLR